MFRRLRKHWLCWRFGICPVHGKLRPHGGYNEGRYGMCPSCREENFGKSTHRDVMHEKSRNAALDRLNRDWALPSRETGE